VQKTGIVTVTDHGIGISKEALQHVFERFYTTDSARSEHGGHGSGLGLAIAAQIVEEHHGHISVSSEDGAGAVVRVQFEPK
jgi:signal transduction histidine kinase